MSQPARRGDREYSKHDLSLLRDLERQSIEQIHRRRLHERYDVQIDVELRPASSSSTEGERIGTTRDISEGGCALMLERPPTVGDVYRVQFTSSPIELPTVFARCVRCALVREDAFEAGFSFFTKISLPVDEVDEAPEDDDLLA